MRQGAAGGRREWRRAVALLNTTLCDWRARICGCHPCSAPPPSTISHPHTCAVVARLQERPLRCHQRGRLGGGHLCGRRQPGPRLGRVLLPLRQARRLPFGHGCVPHFSSCATLRPHLGSCLRSRRLCRLPLHTARLGLLAVCAPCPSPPPAWRSDPAKQRLTVRVLDADVGKADDLLGTAMRGLQVRRRPALLHHAALPLCSLLLLLLGPLPACSSMAALQPQGLRLPRRLTRHLCPAAGRDGWGGARGGAAAQVHKIPPLYSSDFCGQLSQEEDILKQRPHSPSPPPAQGHQGRRGLHHAAPALPALCRRRGGGGGGGAAHGRARDRHPARHHPVQPVARPAARGAAGGGRHV